MYIVEVRELLGDEGQTIGFDKTLSSLNRNGSIKEILIDEALMEDGYEFSDMDDSDYLSEIDFNIYDDASIHFDDINLKELA